LLIAEKSCHTSSLCGQGGAALWGRGIRLNTFKVQAALLARLIIHLLATAIGFLIIFAPAVGLELTVFWLESENWANPKLVAVAAILKAIFFGGDALLLAAFALAGLVQFVKHLGASNATVLETFQADVKSDLGLLAQIVIETMAGTVAVLAIFAIAFGLSTVVELATHIPGFGHQLAWAVKNVKWAFLVLDVLLALAFLIAQVVKFFGKIWTHIRGH
jgi:hypothetical protein